jgi:ATP-binding cassette subfamily B (MDR/TAP) protein 1
MVPFSDLLRFATKLDKILMTIGLVAAFFNGAAFPLFNVVFGQMTDSFGANQDGDGVVTQAKINTM